MSVYHESNSKQKPDNLPMVKNSRSTSQFMPRGIIFDIDGVLTYQGQILPGAIEAVRLLQRKGVKIRFLTNSTLKSRQSCAARLREQDFWVQDDEVLTASYTTAVYLRTLNPRSIWLFLEREGVDEFADFIQDLTHPEYIVIGDNRSKFDFEHLNRALRLLKSGSKLIGMTSELVDSSLGALELNVGSWVKMLELASGIKATYIGKPEPFGFIQALSSMKLKPDQALVVGDRIQSDVLGAQNAGITSVLVKTGEFQESDLDEFPQPYFVINSLEELPGILDNVW